MVKSILERMSGNEAVAHAIKLVEPDVMPHSRSLLQRNFHSLYPILSPMARLIRNLFR